MFESMIADFQSRHDISQAAVLELGGLLQQAALSHFSVLQMVNNAPASVTLDWQEGDPLVELPGDDVDATSTGRYDDLGLLGTGGMGEVRQVLDKDLGRTMAMKILRADLMERPKVVARFIEEAQCSAQLQHPGLVPIHEVGKLPDGRLYFTMAEIRGRTFREVIAEVHAASPGDRWEASAAGWTFRGLMDAFSRVCEAVAYAHSRGVVHRDLKPANIMVGDHGAVRVVDWGLAKVMGRPDLAAEAVLGVMCVAFRALGPLPSRHLDAHPAKYLKSHCASNHVTSASTDKPAFSARNATYMTPWSLGGSWISEPAFARVANRRWYTPGYRDDNLGLRLVRTVP